jgi:hypothetical protein
MVATPAYGGLCYVNFVLSLMNSKEFLAMHGITLDVRFLANESLIPRGRNTLVAKFMNDESFTHLLFIDADVSWVPGTILRLLRHDKDIIGALYPKKGYNFKNLLSNKNILEKLKKAESEKRELTDLEAEEIRMKLLGFVVNREEKSTFGIQNGQMQVKHIGTGFMLIQRHVIQKMFNAYPDLKHDDDIGALDANENRYLYALFNCENHKFGAKTHYLSEDYLFCKRWTDLGGSIFADISIPLTHTGTHPFTGSWASSNNITFLPAPSEAPSENEKTLMEEPKKMKTDETQKIEKTEKTEKIVKTEKILIEQPREKTNDPDESSAQSFTQSSSDEPNFLIQRIPKHSPEPKQISSLEEAKSIAPFQKSMPELSASVDVKLQDPPAQAPPKQRLLPSQLAQIKIL